MTERSIGGWHCSACHLSATSDPESVGCRAGDEHRWAVQLRQGHPNDAMGYPCTCVPAGDREQIARKRTALAKLAGYRVAREQMPDDVIAALDAGASQAEVARASGLSRQWIAKLAARQP